MYNLENILKAMDMMLSGKPIRGETVGSAKFDNSNYHILVDTCFTNDIGKFETAIRVNDNEIVVVDDYDTKEEAIDGHKRWINVCKQKEFCFYSIQDGKFYIYKT